MRMGCCGMDTEIGWPWPKRSSSAAGQSVRKSLTEYSAMGIDDLTTNKGNAAMRYNEPLQPLFMHVYPLRPNRMNDQEKAPFLQYVRSPSGKIG